MGHWGETETRLFKPNVYEMSRIMFNINSIFDNGHSDEFPNILRFWIGISEHFGLLSAYLDSEIVHAHFPRRDRDFRIARPWLQTCETETSKLRDRDFRLATPWLWKIVSRPKHVSDTTALVTMLLKHFRAVWPIHEIN